MSASGDTLGNAAHTSALLLAVDACFGGEGLAHAAGADGAGECSLRFCGGRHSPRSALRVYFMQSKEQ